jgi:DNA polymerase-3 subunit epsilon
MVHWNGDQVVVFDVETTGLEVGYHEIIQIALVALDSNFKLRKGVIPFCVSLKPEYPERIDFDAMEVNKQEVADLVNRGLDPIKVIDLIGHWLDKLELPYTRSGSRKRVRFLGHNVSFDISFLKQLLGLQQYNDWFSYISLDTMDMAGFINNHCAMNAEPIPFPKVGLSYLCNVLNVEHRRKHDALEDCLATAECCREMVGKGQWVA